jgi:uncharacterized protein (DUF433 family)
MMEDPDGGRLLSELRRPRGHYGVQRTSQLSGIPQSTLYDWRSHRVYVPDYDAASPTGWSYRDLVFLRLLAWLRQRGMERAVASEQVARVRAEIEAGQHVRYLFASARTLIAAGERTDRVSGENLLPFDRLEELFAQFDITEPVKELGPSRHRLWAPDLVRPSKHSFIAPSVMAGDPCLNDTRIPTATVYTLRTERDLSSEDVVALYPELGVEAVEDAYGLEARLREAVPSAA